MIRVKPVVLSALVLIASSSAVRSEVVSLSQDRSVLSFATVSDNQGVFDHDSDNIQSSDPGIFSESAQTLVNLALGTAEGTATQLSNILENNVLITGSIASQATVSDPESFAEAFSQSRFHSRFQVTYQTVAAHLSVNVSTQGLGHASLTLIGDLGYFLSIDIPEGESENHSETIPLPPDFYRLDFSLSGFGQSFNGAETIAAGDYYVTLTFDPTVGVDEVPVSGDPVRAWPNPARSFVRIDAAELNSGPIEILDVSGRRVRDLPALSHQRWDLEDQSGQPVAPGVYLLRQGLGGPTTRLIVTR